ncbi:MAG: gfo/Idh/MocA family oxidoreductase [Actinobacteria bacterium]|nr:gfo/Idh/MocA family oxidoreductase [Acidimicrobiia bacterium]NCZ66900.1 gfo/Idh/MocA family oxidoreductase [Acidimicrobiia bacterium]NDI15780.1 gfo/Idh/MocA family oxidoreductase [Actinomycetota bacterium]
MTPNQPKSRTTSTKRVRSEGWPIDWPPLTPPPLARPPPGLPLAPPPAPDSVRSTMFGKARAMSFRWGIAGTGRIASDFVDGLRQVPDAEVVAVCSRSTDSAREFANRRAIARAHGSYEALANDPNVDIVYVATPNSRHRSDTEMYLRAGKHVLCEKPFALNLAEAKSMVRTARDSKRFVMEAIWSRFLPVYASLGEVLQSQPLGRITRVEADLGFVAPTDAGHRLNDPALGGGSVLDLGIYCLHIARFVLGGHESVHAVGELNDQGVDIDATYTLGYANGATAVLRSSLKVATPCVATITGESGTITVERRMHVSPGFTVALNDRAAVYHRHDENGQGLRHQVFEVHRCIEQGFIESPRLTHAETLAYAETMDEIRRQLGVRYASDPATT